MELSKSGAVKVNGCNAMRTESGQWMVSKNGTCYGYCDTLAEVEGLIVRRKQEVLDRLARATAAAEARAREE